jgi:hypothetical protein
MNLLHLIAHRFGWNGGTIETWTRTDGRVMVGFRCAGCRKLSGIHPAPEHIFKP